MKVNNYNVYMHTLIIFSIVLLPVGVYADNTISTDTDYPFDLGGIDSTPYTETGFIQVTDNGSSTTVNVGRDAKATTRVTVNAETDTATLDVVRDVNAGGNIQVLASYKDGTSAGKATLNVQKGDVNAGENILVDASGFGATATLTVLEGDVTATAGKIEMFANDATAMLYVPKGSVTANTITVEGVAGGSATFTADTVAADQITLTEKTGGDVTFTAGTLVVSDKTTVTLTGTDTGDVNIGLIQLGAGSTLTVTGSGSTTFDVKDLSAGVDATYNGALTTAGTIKFHVGNNGNIILTVTGDTDISQATIAFTGSVPKLVVGNQIILLEPLGSFSAPSAVGTKITYNLYEFLIDIDGSGNLVAIVIAVPPKGPPLIGPVNKNNSGGGYTIPNLDPYAGMVNPTVLVSGDYDQANSPIVTLTASASSPGDTVHLYRWQMKDNNTGLWENIPGGTTATFEYDTTGLPPGTYYFRCIVTNDTGGLTISDEIAITIE